MSVQQNDVSNESVMVQKRSRFWQEGMVDFQTVKNLDSKSTDMTAFNMIGCIFSEAAISQTRQTMKLCMKLSLHAFPWACYSD